MGSVLGSTDLELQDLKRVNTRALANFIAKNFTL
jgi:hypothetical protein